MRILVVNEEDYLRNSLSQILSYDGHDITEASSGEEAIESFGKGPFPVVITDINLTDLDGVDLLKKVKEIDQDTEVILITNFASLASAVMAIRSGAYDYLVKNFEDFELISDVVKRAAEKIRLSQENRKLIRKLDKRREELEFDNGRLSDLAMIDEESSLFNQDYFQERLYVEIKRSARHAHQFSLLFIDLAPFIEYSNIIGGDENVLHKLGNCLKSRLRRTDVVTRFSDDKFIVLLPETPRDGAHCVIEKLRKVEDEFPCQEDQDLSMKKVTVNIGISTFPEDGEDGVVLLKQAKDLLNRIKK
jgi:diguanylate cyclase (GGDEF)-like protein